MKVIIIDDEQTTLAIIKNMLLTIHNVELIGSFLNPLEAYEFMLHNHVDVVFVDINMPQESGLDFAKKVSDEFKNIRVCFHTAHKEYALEAFGVHAFDYIVKPVTRERLDSTIQRIKEQLPNHRSDPTCSQKLSVSCLGEYLLKDNNNDIIHLASKKGYELLAFLIFKRGSFVSKWSIMESVFSGMPPKNAETYLNTTVYKLRKVFDLYGLKSIIISADESYRIDLKLIYIDYLDFEERLLALSVENYEEAMQIERMYKGDLFGEKDYEWCMFEKERLLELYINFSKNLLKALISKDNITDALIVAKKLILIYEFDEEANCQLMKLYAKQKDKFLLERQFKRYINLLKKELGIVPNNNVYKLYNELMKMTEAD